MSSPPPSTPNAINPRKRPSISSTASQQGGNNAKRPRMHPLRQTSFPSGGDADGRAYSAASDAGSVTGSYTGSLGGASAATGEGVFTTGKKRGRKKKADKDREDASSTREGLDTRVGPADIDGSSVRGGAGGGGVDDADEDEDLEDEGDLLGGEDGLTDTEAEKKNLAILVDAFNPIQSARYDLFKRAKLRKETLRRIVNHALSQSVPASVVTTINGFTKVFAGEIIEKARTVQQEWAEAFDQAARAEFEREEAEAEAAAAAAAAAASRSSSENQEGANGVKHESPEGGATPAGGGTPATTAPTSIPANIPAALSPAPVPPDHQSPYAPSTSSDAPPTVRPKREFKPPPNPHRGQLLPSHLREALRRYKRDGEGGGVGMSGLSLANLGVRGTFTWNVGMGGRRLFR